MKRKLYHRKAYVFFLRKGFCCFVSKDIKFAFRVSSVLRKIVSVTEYREGFMVANCYYGDVLDEEYFDFSAVLDDLGISQKKIK